MDVPKVPKGSSAMRWVLAILLILVLGAVVVAVLSTVTTMGAGASLN